MHPFFESGPACPGDLFAFWALSVEKDLTIGKKRYIITL